MTSIYWVIGHILWVCNGIVKCTYVWSKVSLEKFLSIYTLCVGAREIDKSVFFPSVLVHSGGVTGGHYYAFIRPTLTDQWWVFCFGLSVHEEELRPFKGSAWMMSLLLLSLMPMPMSIGFMIWYVLIMFSFCLCNFIYQIDAVCVSRWFSCCVARVDVFKDSRGWPCP